jgi:hypothetical protein
VDLAPDAIGKGNSPHFALDLSTAFYGGARRRAAVRRSRGRAVALTLVSICCPSASTPQAGAGLAFGLRSASFRFRCPP